MGIVHVLGLIFITLKLTGHIDWNWFTVLSPFIVSFLVVIIYAILCEFEGR